TPQVVVDGRRQVPGLRRETIEAAVAEEAARADRPAPPLRFLDHGERVAVGPGRVPEGGAELWLVRYQPEAETVRVARGENRGAAVRHANLVRELVRLGEWDGRARQYALPPAAAPHLETVILLQAQADG